MAGDYSSDDPVQRLAAVRTAIAGIMTGSQSYSIRSRSAEKARLQELYRMEQDLKREIAMTGGAIKLIQGIPPV